MFALVELQLNPVNDLTLTLTSGKPFHSLCEGLESACAATNGIEWNARFNVFLRKREEGGQRFSRCFSSKNHTHYTLSLARMKVTNLSSLRKTMLAFRKKERRKKKFPLEASARAS